MTAETTATIDLAPIARELGVSVAQITAVMALLDEGNTVPFITRYRKERTGNLDEEQIRRIAEAVGQRREVAERAAAILRLIDTQGKLTPELRTAIETADSLKRLEDLYLPYRPKRRTRATIAREKGLEPLAEKIWSGEPIGDLNVAARSYVNPALGVASEQEALEGASDLLAERISEDAAVREEGRRVAWQTGRFRVSATKTGQQQGQDYRDYFDHEEPVGKIPPHRILAINRGEKEEMLRVGFQWDDERAQEQVSRKLRLEQHRYRGFLETVLTDALKRLLQPSLDREVRRELTERAEAHAVSVFARNLRQLLLQPPVRGQRVLAIDPGFRTGCKLAALDEHGRCLKVDVVYPTGSDAQRASARETVLRLMTEHNCRLVAIGNGTACRETEEFVAELISERMPEARYVIVNEAGASIYSASPVAREEFPDFDATARGTVSIGRRLLDPLSELVKIEPQHIGVGMYQHDVDPKRLTESLDNVVESCVNYVGVDLNSASASLLRHVSGLNPLSARRIVEYRERNGLFRTRDQLKKVSGIGEVTFTQAAGFLKISDGDEPLDATWIHPESYKAARLVLKRLSIDSTALQSGRDQATALASRVSELDRAALAAEVNVGLPTFNDLIDAILKPGRDPRAELPGPMFRKGVLKMEDLTPGMELKGSVLNVVDFGAFVDVGLKQSGLVHISQMADRFIRSPHEVVSVGDLVKVWVVSVDHERGRVALSMLPPGTPRADSSRPASPSAGRTDRPASGTAPRTNASSSSAPPKSGGPLRGFDELKEMWKKKPN